MIFTSVQLHRIKADEPWRDSALVKTLGIGVFIVDNYRSAPWRRDRRKNIPKVMQYV